LNNGMRHVTNVLTIVASCYPVLSDDIKIRECKK